MANQKKEIVKMILSIAITAAVVFVVTSSYYINNVVKGTTTVTYEYSGDFAKLKKVLGLVNKNFLYQDYKMEELEEGAISGLLSALGDPYTSYFNRSETETFLTQTEGSYEGVGMYITFGKDMEWPMVLSVFEESPAAEAGVKPGDYIYEISGEKITKDTSLEEIGHVLRGSAGTKVVVTFVRENEGNKQENYTVELERSNIALTTFRYEVKDGNIGYIQFTSFDEESDVKFEEAYRKLVEEKKVKGIIIDIRDNPGGLLEKVVKIADRLVPSGIITYTVDKNDRREVKYSDERKSDVPIVILTNGNSASASEILAAAVKDHQIGKVVGQTTYGKGLVQAFVSLRDGTYIKMTIAEYFSPNGTKINQIGVVPDIEVEDNEETEEDEQLEKALEVIKNF